LPQRDAIVHHFEGSLDDQEIMAKVAVLPVGAVTALKGAAWRVEIIELGHPTILRVSLG
jgi:hypothetical protein